MIIRVLSLILFMLTVAGPVPPAIAAQAGAPASDAPCAGDETPAASYRLRVGDVLDVSFRFTPEFNTSAKIRPDGRIAMGSIGDMTAAGLTAAQVTCALGEAYRTQLHDPVISVSVRDFEPPSFIVGGEVERPGKYELRRDTSVAEAIAIAGGFKRSASQSKVYLFRRAAAGGDTETRLLDVKAMLDGHDGAPAIRLQGDDMLFVPQTGFSRIERFIPVPGVFLPVR